MGMYLDMFSPAEALEYLEANEKPRPVRAAAAAAAAAAVGAR